MNTTDGLAGRTTTTGQALTGAMDRQAQDPAAEAPRPRRAARASVPGGPAAPGSPPLAAGGKTLHPEGSPTPLQGGASTSLEDRERAVPGAEAGSGAAGGVRDAASRPLPAGSRGLRGTEWQAAAAKASRRRPAKGTPRAAARVTIPPPATGAALTATATCLGRCDWTAGPGDPAEVDKAAEKHVKVGHPVNVVAGVAP